MTQPRLILACVQAGSVALLLPWIAVGAFLYFAHLFASAYDADVPGVLVGVFGMAIMGLCLLLVGHVIYWLWLVAFRQQRPPASFVGCDALGLLLLLWPVRLVILAEPGSGWMAVTGYVGYLAAILWLYSRRLQPAFVCPAQKATRGTGSSHSVQPHL